MGISTMDEGLMEHPCVINDAKSGYVKTAPIGKVAPQDCQNHDQ